MHLKILVCLLSLSSLLSCTDNKPEKSEDVRSIGKYVYLDTEGILHTNRRCILGLQTSDESDIGHYKGITFIDTTRITKEHLRAMCSVCIGDNDYECLNRMACGHENESVVLADSAAASDFVSPDVVFEDSAIPDNNIIYE